MHLPAFRCVRYCACLCLCYLKKCSFENKAQNLKAILYFWTRFPRSGICSKVNIIARLVLEFASHDIAFVQNVNVMVWVELELTSTTLLYSEIVCHNLTGAGTCFPRYNNPAHWSRHQGESLSHDFNWRLLRKKYQANVDIKWL